MTTTPQWKEEFIDNIIRGGTHELIIDHDRDLIMAFIETQIAQARSDEKKEIKEKLERYVSNYLKLEGYEHDEILEFVSSL